MPLSFRGTVDLLVRGRPLAGLGRYPYELDSEVEKQVREDLRGPGGPPYDSYQL